MLKKPALSSSLLLLSIFYSLAGQKRQRTELFLVFAVIYEQVGICICEGWMKKPIVPTCDFPPGIKCVMLIALSAKGLPQIMGHTQIAQ